MVVISDEFGTPGDGLRGSMSRNLRRSMEALLLLQQLLQKSNSMPFGNVTSGAAEQETRS